MSKKDLILPILFISIILLFLAGFDKQLIRLYARIKAVGLLKERTIVTEEDKLHLKAKPYNENAANYLDVGKYDEAIPEANKAIKIYPRYDKAYANLAIAYYQKGLRSQAMGTVKKALKINPNLYEALNLLGIIYHETGQLGKAIRMHKKVIKLNPNNVAMHQNLAFVYLDAGLFDMSEKEFDKVRSLKAIDTSALKDNKWNNRIEVFQERIRVEPNDARSDYLLGEIYYQLELYDLSIESFNKSIEASPQYKGNDYDIVAAHNNLGASYIQKGMFDEAIASYEKAVGINPKLYISYYGLGVAYWRKGEYREAIRSCQQALQNKPDCLAAQYIIGACFEQLKDYPSTVKEYKEIFKNIFSSKISSIPGCAHLRLAKCYMNMRMKEKALEELNNFQNHFSYLDERRDPYGLLGLFSFMDPVTAQIDGKTFRGKEEIKKAYKDKLPDLLEIKEIRNEDDRRAKGIELFNAGNMYLAFGLNDEAIKLLQESIYFGHYYGSKAHFSIGVAYLQKGLPDKAIDAFYRAIRIGYWSENFFDEIYNYLFLREESLITS